MQENIKEEFAMKELHALSHLRNNQNKTKSLVSKCSVLINNNTL